MSKNKTAAIAIIFHFFLFLYSKEETVIPYSKINELTTIKDSPERIRNQILFELKKNNRANTT